MSWKVHGTDDVFAALRGLCSNSYRMYDPSEHRYYYDHDCETYGCAVEDAAREYERLLRHCDHQRQELAKLTRYMQGEAPAETIDLLMGLLNEYRESGCALNESRVSWYARRLDGRTMNERTGTEQGSSRFEQGSSITDELREFAREHQPYKSELYNAQVCDHLCAIADRIDEQHAKACGKAYDEGVSDGIDADKNAMGYIKGPVDADGVPIKMGDEMELTDEAARRWDGDKHFGKVMGLELTVDGWTVEGDPATDLRHVQPDSWERIIADAADFALDTQHTAGRVSLEPFVERCRRLAGE